MFIRSNIHITALIIRLSLGFVLLAHSLYLKLIMFGLAGTAEFFANVGLPSDLAYVVFVVEVMAGLALIVGWNSQFWALAVIPILLGATWVHFSNGWLFTNDGGGWEYPLFLAAMSAAQVCLGDGKYSLSARRPTAKQGG